MSETENYFQKHGAQWVDDAYKKGATIAHGRLDAVSRLIENLNPESIIDIGCGDGRFLESLGNVKVKIGLDYSESMLALAKANNSNGIRYEGIDLNSDSSLAILKELPKVDVVTMMGVIHYLDSPIKSLTAIQHCLDTSGKLVLSFRNKLFNADASSKYYSSDLTIKNLARLQTENLLWTSILHTGGNLLAELNNTEDGCALVDFVVESQAMNGETDPHWNPDAFENWRQFSPVEAIVLLTHAGFISKSLIAIGDNLAAENPVSQCTSFILVAEKLA